MSSDLLFAFFLTCCVELGITAVLLVALGSRVGIAHRLLGAAVMVVVVAGAGQVAFDAWSLPAGPVEAAEVFLAVVGLSVVISRPAWNPVGQVFFASFVGAALAYISFALDVTFAGNLSVLGEAASAALLVLELSALLLAASFAFETCDVVCRVRRSRQEPRFEPGYQPMVSLHIPAYNEPPEMLIETIRSAERIDYPNFEVVVIDNNTSDPAVWRPVEEYCRGRPRLKFVHVEDLAGFKSGALNLALAELTDPGTEIVGIIDADYVVSPDYLKSTVGYFADPNMAFVQTPQDYRFHEGSAYFTACYDAYRYFFASAMRSRNERNSIIFAGTMGLLRKPMLEAVGGWDDWCITEDADTSLRLLAAGYSSHFVAHSFGRGIMPLTFSSLKKQRFRWCFGGMQILRRHWRRLMPWDRDPDNHLSMGQRLDYLFGGLQWMNDMVLVGFAVVLLVVAGLLLAGSSVAIRPLVGPTILLPGTLLATGLLRAVWALRHQTGITFKRAFLAFANWLSLSLTVARACLQGLVRSEGIFMRTPKMGDSHGLGAALRATIPEASLGALLWGATAALAVAAHPTALLLGLMAWQGAIYWTSPYMSWLAQRASLSPELERRRRTEDLRDRLAVVLRPALAGSAALSAAGLAFVLILGFGASHAGHPRNPFSLPVHPPHSQPPWGDVLNPVTHRSPASTTTTVPPGITTPPTTTIGSTTSSTAVTPTTVTTLPVPTTTPAVSTTTPAAPSTTTSATTTPATTAPPTAAASPTSVP